MHHEGPRKALEAARSAHFSAAEWEAYNSEGIAIQDARGAVSFAIQREALQSRRQVLRMLLKHAGVALTEAEEARVEACDEPAALDGWIVRAATARTVRDVFGG